MKCDVANGWCGVMLCDGHCEVAGVPEDIELCSHRKRMNRLEEAFEKDWCNNELLFQWTKEKERK